MGSSWLPTWNCTRFSHGRSTRGGVRSWLDRKGHLLLLAPSSLPVAESNGKSAVLTTTANTRQVTDSLSMHNTTLYRLPPRTTQQLPAWKACSPRLCSGVLWPVLLSELHVVCVWYCAGEVGRHEALLLVLWGMLLRHESVRRI